MLEEEIKIKCIEIANGDLPLAKDIFNWVVSSYIKENTMTAVRENFDT